MTETQVRPRSAIAVLLLLTGIVSADIAVAAGTYQTMLSAREDQTEARDAFVVSYDGFDDLLNSPAGAPGSFSGVNVSSGYVASGLAYDGQYRLMLSGRSDEGAGRDVFVITYDSFDDLLNSPAGAPGSFSGINVSSDYVASGLAFQPLPAVPEPGSAVTLLAGLALLASTKARFRATH